MNTSKRKQKAIRLGIAAVLALVLLVSVSVVLVIANTLEEVQAYAMTVTLDGKVNLIFKFTDEKVKSGTDSYTAEVGGRTEKITGLQSVKVGDKTVVTVPLMPYEMAEEVKLYQVDKDGNKLAVSTGSVRAYANKVLAREDLEEYHNSVRALLNYGAKTQIDKNANISNLANDGLFVRNNPIDIIKEVPFETLEKTTGDLTGEISLVFSNNNDISDIALRYDITYEAGHDEELRAVINGASEGVRLQEVESGKYRFEITNIGVKNFATVWNVVITAPDGKTSTSQHSVLEYLDWVIDNSEDTEKDVARSLYQLYQNTVGGLLEECKHLNPGYYIPAGENSSYHMCAACGKMINDDPIDNKKTAYFSGKHLSGIKAIGEVDATYSAENGYQITWKKAGSGLELIWLREAYYLSTSLKQADGQWGDVPFDIGNAKYIVIKYKVKEGSGITGITASLGSTKWTYEDTGALVGGTFVPNKDPNGNPYSASQTAVYSTKTVSGNGSTDCAAILSLDDFGDKVAPDENGNRVIDGLRLGIAGKAAVNDTLTIESIEFFTGEIQHGNMETTMTDGVPSTVCTVCNRPVLPENTFIDGNLLAKVPAADSTKCTVSTITDGDNNYYHATTTAGTEHLWFREPYRNTTITDGLSGKAGGKLDASHNVPGFTTVKGDKMTLANGAVVRYFDYPALNVGTARYLVIRARTNFTSAKAFYLYMGTVGFHNPESNAAAQRTGVRFNTANDNTWVTYVLDLENDDLKERAPTVQDANGKDIRIFDSFYLGLQVGDMDIDYIAFVNKLSDVADITEDDSVRIINDISTGASTLTDKADLKN